MKATVLILLSNFILSSIPNGIENKLLQIIHQELIKGAKIHSLKEHVIVYVNPVQDELRIVIDDSIDINEFKFINEFNDREKEFLGLLDLDLLNINPIKDSIIIIDTIGFFSRSVILNNINQIIVINNKSDYYSKSINCTYLYLHSFSNFNNELVLSFSTPDSRYLFNFYFQISNNNIDIKNRKAISIISNSE